MSVISLLTFRLIFLYCLLSVPSYVGISCKLPLSFYMTGALIPPLLGMSLFILPYNLYKRPLRLIEKGIVRIVPPGDAVKSSPGQQQ